MKPIITFTMNPALNVNTSVERVVGEHKLRGGSIRVAAASTSPG
jgi:fructose-1-phosphate kinase PfkB-like protein